MKDSKTHGKIIKGRCITLVGINSNPYTYILFDEPKDYDKDEQNSLCKSYFIGRETLKAYVIYQKLIDAYNESTKKYFKEPLIIRS